MSDPVLTRHDEDGIDLFDLLETLWAGKLVILASGVLPLLAALGLLQTSKPVFEVIAPYYVQVAPMEAYDLEVCSGDQCRRDMAASRIMSLPHGEWRSIDYGFALALTTESPGPVAEYQYILGELNQAFRANILYEAEAQADLIENEIGSDMRRSEVVASSLLQAKRVISLLERDVTPLAFDAVSINEMKNNTRRFIWFPAFYGTLAGSVFVLLRKAFRNRRITKGQIRS